MASRNIPTRRARGAKKRKKHISAAAFALSWDGRLIAPGLPGEARHFRERLSGDGLDELWIAFRPCVMGGKTAGTVTGLSEDFLPRGIVLDLLKLERRPSGLLAKYRVRAR